MGRKTKNYTWPKQDSTEKDKKEEREQQMQELPVSRNCVHFDKNGMCYKGDEVDDQTGIRFVDGIAVSR